MTKLRLTVTTKACAVAHSAPLVHNAKPHLPQSPISRDDLKSTVAYLSEFESKFETVLDDASGDQMGTFGHITLDQKNLTILSL